MTGPVGQSNTITGAGGGGAAVDAVIDIDDEVPDPGDTTTVRVQAVDAAGNGVPRAGIVVGLTVAGDAVGTLGAASVTTDTNGRGTTTLTIDGDAPAGSRCYVGKSSFTLP